MVNVKLPWLLSFLVSFAAFGSEASGKGRVIEFGWDTPTIPWLCDNAAITECTTPFHGIILDLARREDQGGLSWLAWGNTTIAGELLQRAEEDIVLLNDANFTRLGENSFYRLNSSGWSAPADWFDADFSTVVSNITFIAGAVNQTSLDGVAFDPEDYFSNCWYYPGQKYSATKTFEQYQTQVRQRGRQIASAIKSACPGRDFTLLFLFANSLPYISTQWWGHPLHEDSYGLLPAFIDGLLDEAGEQIRIIDGIESAYPNKTLAEFQTSISNYQGGATLSADPSRYLSCVGIGFGTWMDYRSNDFGWYTNPDEFNLNHFTPATFNQAMDISTDLAEISWVYTQIPDWYLGDVPEAYFDALADVTELPLAAPCAEFWASLLRAKDPLPADAARNVHPEVVLSWQAGIKAASHDVYLGTDSDAVQDANTAVTLDVYMGPQGACEYTPVAGLELGRTYYWRIDEVNDANVWKGNVWSFTADDGRATYLSPADASVDTLPDVTLSWSPGVVAASHDVYLGTDLDGVRDANTSSMPEYKGNQLLGYTVYPAGPLDLGQTYYWRIDEVNPGYSDSKGDAWSFTVDDGKATYLSPPNGSADNLPDVTLSWSPGVVAASHDVYLGTDFDGVKDANRSSAEFKDNLIVDVNSYVPAGGLVLGWTYYWRIDEVNPGYSDSKGDLWSFTVVDYIVIDDMESYNTTHNMIIETWLDVRYNSTGAYLRLGVEPSDPVNSGRQSMRYAYDNSGSVCNDLHYYAEAVRTFSAPWDWTDSTMKILTLYFYGNPENDANAAEQMYVGLQDTDSYAQAEYGDNGEDMNDITISQWHEWNIRLQDFNDRGLDLGDVNKIYIGFGDRGNLNPGGVPGGSGIVYFDDIRLYPPRCVPSLAKPPADFDNNCFVDFGDLAILAGQWLQPPGNPSADIAPEVPDGIVDWLELGLLADNWLTALLWPPQ